MELEKKEKKLLVIIPHARNDCYILHIIKLIKQFQDLQRFIFLFCLIFKGPENLYLSSLISPFRKGSACGLAVCASSEARRRGGI